MSDDVLHAMLDIARQAIINQYSALLPAGYTIYKLDVYDKTTYPAPNLWLDKKQNPKVKYIAILTSDHSSVPALGETATAAVDAAIAKIQTMEVKQPN